MLLDRTDVVIVSDLSVQEVRVHVVVFLVDATELYASVLWPIEKNFQNQPTKFNSINLIYIRLAPFRLTACAGGSRRSRHCRACECGQWTLRVLVNGPAAWPCC